MFQTFKTIAFTYRQMQLILGKKQQNQQNPAREHARKRLRCES